MPPWPTLRRAERAAGGADHPGRGDPGRLVDDQPAAGSDGRLGMARGQGDRRSPRCPCRRRSRSPACGIEVARHVGLMQQAGDLLGIVERGVGLEVRLGHRAQLDRAGDLAAQVGRRAAQRRRPRPPTFAPPSGMTKAVAFLRSGTDPHLGDGDRDVLQHRVAEMGALDDLGQGVAQLLADAQLALARTRGRVTIAGMGRRTAFHDGLRRQAGFRGEGCGRARRGRADYSVRATSSISKHSITSPGWMSW